jgi:hypothetical protein
MKVTPLYQEKPANAIFRVSLLYPEDEGRRFSEMLNIYQTTQYHIQKTGIFTITLLAWRKVEWQYVTYELRLIPWTSLTTI